MFTRHAAHAFSRPVSKSSSAKNSLPKVLAGCALFALAAMQAACTSGKFQGNAVRTGPAADAPAGSRSDSFPVQSRKGSLDLVWAIDNSGSMSEEAAIVRANFQSFLQGVSSRADLRLALLSSPQRSSQGPLAGNGFGGFTAFATPSDTGVTLPSMGSNFIQIPSSFVGSTNPLAMAAAASCAANLTSLSTNSGGLAGRLSSGSICGEALVSLGGASGSSLEDPRSVQAVAGTLTSFLRPDAARAYVFVTDDNASGVSEQNFLAAIARGAPSAKPATVFGFVGLNQTSCGIAEVGSSYIALAQQTGGAVFDLCAPDWSANFGRLTENLLSLAQSGYPLPGQAASVSQIRVDGRILAPSDYSLQGNMVQVNPNALQNATTIEIDWLPRST